jgi:hypothetical protein
VRVTEAGRELWLHSVFGYEWLSICPLQILREGLRTLQFQSFVAAPEGERYIGH